MQVTTAMRHSGAVDDALNASERVGPVAAELRPHDRRDAIPAPRGLPASTASGFPAAGRSRDGVPFDPRKSASSRACSPQRRPQVADLLLAANHAGDIQLDPVVRDRATMELALAAAVLIDLAIEKRIRINTPGCVRIIAGNPGDDPLSHRVVHELRRIAQPRSVTDSLYVLAAIVTPLVWTRLAHRGDAQPRDTRTHRRPRFDFVGLRAIRRPHLYLTAAADHDPIATTATSLWRLLTLLRLDGESTDLMLSDTTTARLTATEPAPQVTTILSAASLALHVHATVL